MGRITRKDGTMTQTEMDEILETIEYKDWTFITIKRDHVIYLRCSWWGECNTSGMMTRQKSRKWQLSPHMTKSELVQTALKAVLTAEEHEAREKFKYKGKAVFGPHIDIEQLYLVCDNLEERK